MVALIALALIIGVVAAVLWAGRGAHAPLPEVVTPREDPDALHAAYAAGDGERVAELLPGAELNTQIALSTALGRYQEALDLAADFAPETLDPTQPLDALLRVVRLNVAEALSELGRYGEALALVEAPLDDAYLETGRRTTRAWILVLLGRVDEAVALLREVRPGALGRDYAGEVFLAAAFALTAAGDLANARALLDEGRLATVRASTERNLLVLEAELAWKEGDLARARERFEQAAAHRWRWQGGAGLLRWGELLAQQDDAAGARAAWTRCVAQDPQSRAAETARRKLG